MSFGYLVVLFDAPFLSRTVWENLDTIIYMPFAMAYYWLVAASVTMSGWGQFNLRQRVVRVGVGYGIPWVLGLHVNYWAKAGILSDFVFTAASVKHWTIGVWIPLILVVLALLGGGAHLLRQARRERTLGNYIAGYTLTVVLLIVIMYGHLK